MVSSVWRESADVGEGEGEGEMGWWVRVEGGIGKAGIEEVRRRWWCEVVVRGSGERLVWWSVG